MQLDELLERLDGVKASGEGGFVARCPAHTDHRQSLSLGLGTDNRVLVKCHAGCHADDICRALGIEAKDLFPAPAPNGKPKIVATYDYVDEHGELLYQAVRFEPKDFRQRRPDGAGGWEWKTAGTRRVLYHLPEVLAAAAKGETIYVVEGEKDAEAIREYGEVATCNAGGAGKWRPEYSEALSGANLVIVADKDEPGRKHAFAVSAAIVGKAKDIKIVEAAQGKDAADHLEAGFTLNEFVAITSEEEKSKADAAQLGAIAYIDWPLFWTCKHADEEWLFQDVIALGRAHVIYAKHGVGKSLFTAYMCAKMAAEKRAVVQYLDFEMTQADLYERLSDMGYGPETDLSLLNYALLPSMPPLDTQAGGEILLESVDALQAKYPDLPLVTVVDTMSRAVLGEDDKADTIRAFYRHCGLGLKQRGITWVRIDHEGKDKTQGQRGTSAKGDDVDVVWQIERTESGVQLHRKKSRMGWVPERTLFGEFYGPLRFLPVVSDWPAGTATLANIIDRLELPLDAPTRTVQTKLREVDEGRRRELVVAAMRWRKERDEEAGNHFGNRRNHSFEHSEQSAGTAGNQVSFSLGTAAGTAGTTDQRQDSVEGSPRRGGPHAGGSGLEEST